jgi:5'-methylthioadenosine phosphorylase
MTKKPRGREDEKPHRRGTPSCRNDSTGNLPRFAVIGGSQAFRFLKNSGWERLGPRTTPFGESQPIYHAHCAQEDYLFLSRHGEAGYSIAASFVNYRANLYALKDLGTSQIISWSGPGAISTEFKIGQFVIIDDIIDETRRRPATFFERGGLGFIRQNPVFCPHLRDLIAKTLQSLEIEFAARGAYVCTEGPRLETPAEIRKFALYGAQLVGMTLAPEIFLAKELEMCYAALCYVTNYAEGIRETAFQPGVLFEGLASADEFELVERSIQQFPIIIGKMAQAAQESRPKCSCGQAMQRYRERGGIGENWREWIQA